MKPSLITSIAVLWLSLVIAFGLNLGGCSSGDSDPNGAAPTADAATSAVTDGMASSLGALSGAPATLATKSQSQSESSSTSYSCSLNESDASQTCDCPGGGTVTFYHDDVHILGDFDHSFRQVFDACVVPSCDGDKTIDGEVTGRVQGHIDPGGDIEVTATLQTAEQCAGLSVDDVNVGFEINLTWDGTDQTVGGTICLDPPGDVITFDSFEELMEIMDPDSECSLP